MGFNIVHFPCNYFAYLLLNTNLLQKVSIY